MHRTIRFLLPVAALALAATAFAGDDKHVWVVPTNVSQALSIKLETKATPDLLKKIGEQCLDDDCKKQLAACQAAANCVLMPSKESVRESEVENN